MQVRFGGPDQFLLNHHEKTVTMIFSAQVSAVLLLFFVIIYPNDGVNGYKEPCNYKVERMLANYCASNGRHQRDRREVNGDSGRPLHALQKRQISPDAHGASGSPPPISDHGLSMKMGSTNSDDIIGHPSRAAKNLSPARTLALEDYSARCCGEMNDCSNPPASILPCPGVYKSKKSCLLFIHSNQIRNT